MSNHTELDGFGTLRLSIFFFFIYSRQTGTRQYSPELQAILDSNFYSIPYQHKRKKNAGIKTINKCIRKSSNLWMKDNGEERKLTQSLPPPRPGRPASPPFHRHQLHLLRRLSQGFWFWFWFILFGSAPRNLHRLCKRLFRLYFWKLQRRRHQRNDTLPQRKTLDFRDTQLLLETSERKCRWCVLRPFKNPVLKINYYQQKSKIKNYLFIYLFSFNSQFFYLI